MCPKHCTMVAMLSPKQREIRTMSTGRGFSAPPQLIVEPRLRRTKMSMAKNSAETAFQKGWVQTPLNATMMLSHLHRRPHLLKRKTKLYQKSPNKTFALLLGVATQQTLERRRQCRASLGWDNHRHTPSEQTALKTWPGFKRLQDTRWLITPCEEPACIASVHKKQPLYFFK